MTVGEYIDSLNQESMVALKNKYGVFYIGKVKFIFGALSYKAWIEDVETCGFEIIVH